jgi:hypothetical protein
MFHFVRTTSAEADVVLTYKEYKSKMKRA